MRFLPTITASLALTLPLIALGAPAHAAAPTCAGERATVVGNAKANNLSGTAKRDVIWAGDGNDTISGLGGNDLICAGAGADRISGGPDDDTIYGELDHYRADAFGRFHRTGDTIVPGAGAGNDYVDPGYDARPVSVGVEVEQDMISYFGAPAPAVVDLRAVPDAGSGDDKIVSVAGYDTLAGGADVDAITSTSLNSKLIKGGSGGDAVTMPVPSESGFKVVGNGGQDKLRMVPYANPAIFPTVRIDQRKGLTRVTKPLPVAVSGKIQSFTEVSLPGNAKTIYKGTDKGEAIDPHPDFRAIITARGGADVLTGSNAKDLLIGGKGFDIEFGKSGKDRCKLIERRKSC